MKRRILVTLLSVALVVGGALAGCDASTNVPRGGPQLPSSAPSLP